MELTLFTTKSCGFCDTFKILLKMFNIDFSEKNINELYILNIDYNKVPVIKYNNQYILNYDSLNDLLTQLNIEQFTLDEI